MLYEVPGPYNFCAWIVSYGMKQLTSHLYPSLWYIKKGFPNNSVSKEFPCNAGELEAWVRSLVGKPPWRRERLPTQLAWRIPWIALSMGSQRVGHNWPTFTSLYGRYPSIWFILFMILSIFIFLKLAECMFFFFFSFSPFPFSLSMGAYILLFIVRRQGSV